MLTDAQQRNAAKKFAAEWHGRGYEKGETHAFGMELLHMVCGRLEMRIRYSPAVYNNFPFPEISEEQKVAIEKAGQKILDARCKYPDATLADLY